MFASKITWQKLRLFLAFGTFAQAILLAVTTKAYAQESHSAPTFRQRIPVDTTAFQEQNYNEFSITEDEEEDEGNYTPAVSPVLRGVADVFLNNAFFAFSASRYRFRGYDYRENQLYLNGMSLRDLERRTPGYNYFFGITDLLYSKTIERGSNSTTFSSGGLGVFTDLSSEAYTFAPRFRARYSASNRNYRHRIALSYHSGLGVKKWAFSGMLTARLGKGYFAGTFQNSVGGYFSVSKIIDRHSFSLSTLGGWLSQARQSAILQETYKLAHTERYNPLWGMDNRRERSVRSQKLYRLYTQLTHTWKISANSELKSNISFSFSSQANGLFDWFDGTNPSPEYYRKLPSFYRFRQQNVNATLLDNFLSTHPEALQIDFANIRNIHQNLRPTQIGNITGVRAHYILADRVVNRQQIAINSTYSKQFSALFSLHAGLLSMGEVARNFMRVTDLLGADYWLDINSFYRASLLQVGGEEASEQLVQNDLQKPNRAVRAGEKYRYDYALLMWHNQLWAQGILELRKLQIHLGASLEQDLYFRQGYTKNGLFPTRSLGKSRGYNFNSYQVKLGISYKINGKNLAYLHLLHNTQNPLAEQIFIAPYLHNQVLQIKQLPQNYSLETGYQYRSESISLRLDGFITDTRHEPKIYRFYNDEFRSFAQYSLRDIHKLYYGAEFALEIQLPLNLTLSTVSSLGIYRYMNNPKAWLTADNSPNISQTETIYFKNLPVEGTPQGVHSLSLFYRNPNFWYIGLQGLLSYANYAYMNPVRRTLPAIIDLNPKTQQSKIQEIFQPTRIPAQYWLNLVGGYSKSLKLRYRRQEKTSYLSVYLNVQNLLNRRNFILTAFEQLRYDFRNQNPNQFPPRYFFAMGINYNLSLTFSF